MFYDNIPGNVLVFAEHRGGEIDSAALQMASKGREIADRMNRRLNALLVGYQLDSVAKQLLDKGFDTVFVADNRSLERYNPELYAKVILEFLKKDMPCLFLLGYTYLGMELGPSLATGMDVRLISNCVDARLSDDGVIVTRPMFGGVAHIRLQAKKLPLMISLQKDVLSAGNIKQKHGTLEPIQVNVDTNGIKTKIGALLQEPMSGVDITKADVLVVVGQGVTKQSDIELFKELADALHGTIACTRPLAQWGWLPPDCYIGISGKIVHPKVFIACGISGAPQHVAGMKDSGMIIAINKNPDAPIFQVAHYGIVGDMFEVVPALLKTAREVTS